MKVLSIVAMLLSAQAIKLSADPPAKVNPHDGLVHGKGGARSFPEGGAVGGVNVMDNTTPFKGPVPSPRTGEDASGMRHVDIVQSQGNGHVGAVYPYRQDTTGAQANIVSGIRAGWTPPPPPPAPAAPAKK